MCAAFSNAQLEAEFQTPGVHLREGPVCCVWFFCVFGALLRCEKHEELGGDRGSLY